MFEPPQGLTKAHKNLVRHLRSTVLLSNYLSILSIPILLSP